ncbi:hypothetical protein [Streptomyces noursei]|uniref:Helix-turn-helix domain-containing protein n=1 Tax=Streptomyces noursei TaxID=1971 RepID=A0A2N8P8D0_STRNR|nr:hypothetical protein [Streptomyces noursei]PNE37281.1 hypothetical protein AOB60_23230 [Streptomyces noursei]
MTSPETNRTRAAREAREALIEAAKKALEQGEVMLAPEEAAHVIGCGPRWLRDGANHRGFPHHRFGKFLRFSLQDCREIQEMNRKRARPSEPAKARRRNAATRKSTGGGPATQASIRFKPAA